LAEVPEDDVENQDVTARNIDQEEDLSPRKSPMEEEKPALVEIPAAERGSI
jgi:hypothetical protein